jgi:hypothetical protein
VLARRKYVTTKSKRRGWVIGLSVFAALLAIAVAADVYGSAPATKTDAATATSSPSSAARSCHQQAASWKASAADRSFREAKAGAARVARLAQGHQAAALRRDGAALAAAVRDATAHPLPSCLDIPGYYRTAMIDLSAAARAAAAGSFPAVLRWVSAARAVLARAEDELTPAHHQQHRAAARPAPSSPAPAAATSGPTERGCYPLSDEGTCYEPGEFCRAADQGVAGIAGDGQTIVCMDDHGLRWMPTG